MEQHSTSHSNLSESARLREAAQLAESQVREDLLERPRHEVLEEAVRLHRAYRALLDLGHRREGRISTDFFCEVLDDAYPEFEQVEKRVTAAAIEDLIREKFGNPKHGITQVDVNVSSSRADAAKHVLAASLAPVEIKDLEQVARGRIPADEFPENFDDFKTEWLAEWIVKGILTLPSSN